MSLRSSASGLIPEPLASYGLAVLSVGLAYAISTVFRNVFEPIPYMLFWGAVALTASYGGLGPALLAVTLSIFAVHYFLTGEHRERKQATDCANHVHPLLERESRSRVSDRS